MMTLPAAKAFFVLNVAPDKAKRAKKDINEANLDIFNPQNTLIYRMKAAECRAI